MRIKLAIFDFDLCIFDTHSLGEYILDPVIAPLLASRLTEDIKKQVVRELWSTSLEDCFVRYNLPDELRYEMRIAHQTLMVPDTIRTYGDEDEIAKLTIEKVLVTSGYHDWQTRKIERTGVAHLFADIIIDTIDDPTTRLGKRYIFVGLMEARGLRPHEILVIGDNPHSELKVGNELGMITVQTLRPRVERVDGFDHYVSSLAELPAIVAQYE